MAELPRIVGLYSPAPGSGKTTVAKYLVRRNFVTVSFAEPLKRMTRILLLNLGYHHTEIDELLTKDKERVLPDIRTSTRHILQTLGTEFGRQCIHPDLWLLCWRDKADHLLQAGASIVCDDVRYPNEAELIRQLGGEIWHLSRPDTERVTTHGSEGSLDSYAHFSRHLVNSGTYEDLFAQVEGTSTPVEA